MSKQWIVMSLSASLAVSTGCVPRKTETVDGSKVCFSYTCIKEADAESAAARKDRQLKNQLAQEELKRQEKAAKREEDLNANPWKAYSIEQVRQVAKDNQIALFMLSQSSDGVLDVHGIDVASIRPGVNVYGQPMVTGTWVTQPIRDKNLYPHNAMPTWTALCQAGIMIDPRNQVTDVKQVLKMRQRGEIPASSMMLPVWDILCSYGKTYPEPEYLGGSDPSSPPAAPAKSAGPREGTVNNLCRARDLVQPG